jgi:hypothetical protein
VEWTEGPPNKEQGDGRDDGSLQSHSGANRNPKTAKDRSNVPKGGEAGGVALTDSAQRKCVAAWPPGPVVCVVRLCEFKGARGATRALACVDLVSRLVYTGSKACVSE